MKKMSISVIIPTYNRVGMIGKAVLSALQQCESEDEIIVVDDGSTDDTSDAVSQFGERVKYHRIPHSGAGVARNYGVKKAECALVAFLDSDDEWMPGKLTLQRNLMSRRPDILFCFSDFAVKDGQGREEHNYVARWHNDHRGWDEILGHGEYFSTLASLPPTYEDFRFHVGNIYSSELIANYIFTGTLMVRRQEAGPALHFGEGLPTFEDWECFGRLARQGPAAFLDCETAWQISHPGDRLTRADILHTATARITLMERVWGEDTEFMSLHGDLYEQTLSEQRLLKVRGLLKNGLTKEARVELANLTTAPLSYRIMASVPSKIVTSAVKLRNILSID